MKRMSKVALEHDTWKRFHLVWQLRLEPTERAWSPKEGAFNGWLSAREMAGKCKRRRRNILFGIRRGMDGPINQAATTNGSSFRSQKSCTSWWWLFTAIVLGFITICQGPFGLRVESFGDNLLPSDKSQTLYPKDCRLKLANGAMSSWHCTWEEGRLPFRSRVQGWGSHVCPLLQLHSPPTTVSGQERLSQMGTQLSIFSWLIILKFDQFPKKQSTQSHSKDSQETKAFLKWKEVWCILTPKKMMLPIHISSLYTANGLTV